LVKKDLDLVATVGPKTAYIIDLTVAATASVSVELRPVKENPLISAIEVIPKGPAPAPGPAPVPAPSPAGSLPWLETFQQADGTKVDTGATSWTATRSTGTFGVQTGALHVKGGGPEAVLMTGNINTSGTSSVTVSLDVLSKGNLEVNQDYVRLYAKVDNKPEVLIGEKLGQQVTTTTISGTINTGNQLVLVIRAYVSATAEEYFVDNLAVSPKQPSPVAPVPSPPSPVPPPAPTPQSGQSAIFINCGGGDYTDTQGNVWKADTPFVSGGKLYSTGSAIAGTDDDKLYQTERWGVMTYQIPIALGEYEVQLHFAEIVSETFCASC